MKPNARLHDHVSLEDFMRVVSLSRKPCSTSTTTANVIKHEAGALNIDKTRIGYSNDSDLNLTKSKNPGTPEFVESTVYGSNRPQQSVTETGRWPANIILKHRNGCVPQGTTTIPGYSINRWVDGAKPFGGGAGHDFQSEKRPDEEIQIWDCEENCPILELGNQSGGTISRIGSPRLSKTAGEGWGMTATGAEYEDEGTAARFFKQVQEATMQEIPSQLVDYLVTLISPPPSCNPVIIVEQNLDNYVWSNHEDSSVHGIITMGNPEPYLEEMDRVLRPGAHVLLISTEEDPTGHEGACAIEDFGYEIRDAIAVIDTPGEFHYVAKANSSERNSGILVRESSTGRLVQNDHPTVKPIGIMEALLQDIPKNAIVVDPFTGSGTTGVACLRTKHHFVGIEQDPQYIQIADQRLRYWERFQTAWKETVIESEAPPMEEEDESMDLENLFGVD